MVKTYVVELSRIFKGTGKRVKEKIQVDANTCATAKGKVRSFYRKTSTTPITIKKCSVAKRKAQDYLRI